MSRIALITAKNVRGREIASLLSEVLHNRASSKNDDSTKIDCIDYKMLQPSSIKLHSVGYIAIVCNAESLSDISTETIKSLKYICDGGSNEVRLRPRSNVIKILFCKSFTLNTVEEIERVAFFDHLYSEDRNVIQIGQRILGTRGSHHFGGDMPISLVSIFSCDQVYRYPPSTLRKLSLNREAIIDDCMKYIRKHLTIGPTSGTSEEQQREVKIRSLRFVDYITMRITNVPDSKWVGPMLQLLLKSKAISTPKMFDRDLLKMIDHLIRSEWSAILSDRSIYCERGCRPTLDVDRSIISDRSEMIDVRSSSNGYLFDFDCIKSFLTCKIGNLESGAIPYDVPWIGVIDSKTLSHQRGDPFQELNRLLDDADFHSSLITCEALICFSKSIVAFVKERLRSLLSPLLDEVDIGPLVVLMDRPIPFRFREERFQLDRYLQSKHRKIVQRGVNDQNIFSLYTLDLPFIYIKTVLFDSGSKSCYDGLGSGSEWQHHFDGWISQRPSLTSFPLQKGGSSREMEAYSLMGTVVPMDISNDSSPMSLDTILQESVVYIDHIGNADRADRADRADHIGNAESALGTIDFTLDKMIHDYIERTVPILIRKSSLTIELLGERYPMFWSSYDDIPLLLRDATIRETYLYLEQYRERFLLETFPNRLRKSVLDRLEYNHLRI